ncbi:hypothetical protein, partial [Bacillus subtilis]
SVFFKQLRNNTLYKNVVSVLYPESKDTVVEPARATAPIYSGRKIAVQGGTEPDGTGTVSKTLESAVLYTEFTSLIAIEFRPMESYNGKLIYQLYASQGVPGETGYIAKHRLIGETAAENVNILKGALSLFTFDAPIEVAPNIHYYYEVLRDGGLPLDVHVGVGTNEPFRRIFYRTVEHKTIAVVDELPTTADKTKWNAMQPKSEKGQANGYAGLDADGKLPMAQVPDALVGGVQYKGVWDASTNTPEIPKAKDTNKGFYYRVSVEGTTEIDGTNQWSVGDWIISDGKQWDRIDNTESVTSVAGKKGAVVLNKNDVGLDKVDNTSDLEKPVSTATQNALNQKENAFTKNTGFNKNFGISATDVAKGNHAFDKPVDTTGRSNGDVPYFDEASGTIKFKAMTAGGDSNFKDELNAIVQWIESLHPNDRALQSEDSTLIRWGTDNFI